MICHHEKRCSLRVVLAVLCIYTIICFLSCGGGGSGGSSGDNVTTSNSGDIDSDDLTKASGVIRASTGGTITTANGTSLYVPPGVLEEDKKITITPFRIYTDDILKSSIAVKLEPDGLKFSSPVSLSFYLPDDWDGTDEIEIYEAPASDPDGFLDCGKKAKITSQNGAYKASVDIEHFSSIAEVHGYPLYMHTLLDAKTCHQGTMKYLANQLFAGTECEIDKAIYTAAMLNGRIDFIHDKPEIRAFQTFLKNYFNQYDIFDANEPIKKPAFDAIVDAFWGGLGRKVVFLFTKDKWRPDEDYFGYYKGLKHSAVLEMHNGFLKIRNSSSIKTVIDACIAKNGENVFWYPAQGDLTLADLNAFRNKKSGAAAEEALGQTLFSKERTRIVPWGAVRILIEKNNVIQDCASFTAPLHHNCSFFVGKWKMFEVGVDPMGWWYELTIKPNGSYTRDAYVLAAYNGTKTGQWGYSWYGDWIFWAGWLHGNVYIQSEDHFKMTGFNLMHQPATWEWNRIED